MDRNTGSVSSRAAALAAAASLAMAIVIFVLMQRLLWQDNGFWGDEVFTLWATDPNIPFGDLFLQRMLPETNPPGHPVLLYLSRAIVSTEAIAIFALNLVGLSLSCIYVILSARQNGLAVTGTVACSVFIASAPVLLFAQEGRAYLLAMCMAFVIAWDVAMAVRSSPGRPPPKLRIGKWAILGVLAAILHLYGALIAGCGAAALVLEGLLRRDRTLWLSGLALGLGATLVFAIWIGFALPVMSNIDWLEFTPDSIFQTFWYVKALTVGSGLPSFLVALVLLGVLAVGARDPGLATVLRAFAVMGVLFLLLPILASFVTPILRGKYTTIGLPAFFVLVVLVLRHLAPAGLPVILPSGLPNPRAAAVAMGGLGLVCALMLSGGNVAPIVSARPNWDGASLVQAARNCPPGSVRIGGRFFGRPGLYSAASGVPASVFVLADANASVLTPAAAPCPVLGWYEHIDLTAPKTDQDLVQRLGIAYDEGSLQVVRHASGYVVLRTQAGSAP